MRQVLPDPRPVEPEDLLELYDWPSGGWVRGCMAYSLDGAVAGPDGSSGSISSPADRAVLSATRGLADAYLVGAATVRAEGYSPVLARPDLAERRARLGLADAPVLAVVTGTCRFDWSASRFQASARPPLLLTTSQARAEDRSAAVRAGCEVVVLGAERVDPADVLDLLRERGLARITVEGGPALLAQLAAAGLIDEVDLTVSPTLVGTPQGARGEAGSLHRMRLVHLLEDAGFLFTRYVRSEVA